MSDTDEKSPKRLRIMENDDEEGEILEENVIRSEETSMNSDSVENSSAAVGSAVLELCSENRHDANFHESNAVNENQSQAHSCRSPYGPNHKIDRQPHRYHLLLCVTGSVATIKLNELIEHLYKLSPSNRLVIRIVTTDAARKFFNESAVNHIVYTDRDEVNMWQNRGDPVLHIALRNWSDAMLIAPLDANTLAKIALGLCDNLLTCIVRAWHPNKRVFVAPAMNSAMWENPITHQHRRTLRDLFNFKEIPPIEKQLMCGDEGCGAMATLSMIASIVAADVKSRFAVYSDSSKP